MKRKHQNVVSKASKRCIESVLKISDFPRAVARRRRRICAQLIKMRKRVGRNQIYACTQIIHYKIITVFLEMCVPRRLTSAHRPYKYKLSQTNHSFCPFINPLHCKWQCSLMHPTLMTLFFLLCQYCHADLFVTSGECSHLMD